MSEKKKVLFICTHNSARSQMAEGILNSVYGDKFEAHSAGTKPSIVNPYAIKAMKEIGIEISNQTSKSVDDFSAMNFDYVITVCNSAKETCPRFPGARNYIHKSFADPSTYKGTDEESYLVFAEVRDEIRSWIQNSFVN